RRRSGRGGRGRRKKRPRAAGTGSPAASHRAGWASLPLKKRAVYRFPRPRQETGPANRKAMCRSQRRASCANGSATARAHGRQVPVWRSQNGTSFGTLRFGRPRLDDFHFRVHGRAAHDRLGNRRAFVSEAPEFAKGGLVGVGFDEELRGDAAIARVPGIALAGPLQNVVEVSFEGDFEIVDLDAAARGVQDETNG